MSRHQFRPSTQPDAAKQLARAAQMLGTQQALAEYLGVTDAAISRWIGGQRAVPRPIAVAVGLLLEQPHSAAYYQARGQLAAARELVRTLEGIVQQLRALTPEEPPL